MAPKKALPKARKRQLLSSGMMRKRTVEAYMGSGSSGGSRDELVDLRDKERGLVASPVTVWSGVVPMPAKEKEDGGAVVPFDGGCCAAGFRTWVAEELVLGLSVALVGFSLTINCPPSSRLSRSPNFVDAEY